MLGCVVGTVTMGEWIKCCRCHLSLAPLRCCPSLPRLKVDKNRARKKLGLLSTARDFFTALHSRRSDRKGRFDDALALLRGNLHNFHAAAQRLLMAAEIHMILQIDTSGWI